MQRNLGLWQFAGFTITVALGTVLHFLFGWTRAFSLAPISAVNESTFEHIKILFFPMLFFACVQHHFFRASYPGFWWIKCIGIVVGTVCIPVFFYTYNGAFGKTPDWLNITFFFLSAGLGFFIEYLLFTKDVHLPCPWIALTLVIALAVGYAFFTFYPLQIPLFQDPVTGKYGIV